jgi:hypothetical protein
VELRGDNLIAALETTNGALITVRDSDGRQLLGSLCKAAALMAARSGLYFGVGSPTRVRNLRWIDDERRNFPEPDPSFRDGRGMFWFPWEVSRGMVSRTEGHLFTAPERARGKAVREAPRYWRTKAREHGDDGG